MTYRPTTILEALCIAEGRQGGTIHQYSPKQLRWRCMRPPSARRNTEGLYALEYTRKDGSVVDLGFIGGPSIAAVRAFSCTDPIDPFMTVLWHLSDEIAPSDPVGA